MKMFVFTPPDEIHSARASTCCIKRSRGTSARGHFIFRALTPDRKNKRPFHPCPLAARPRRRRLPHPPPAAAAPRSQAEHGLARLWLVLDRRCRMGEGSAAGVPWGDGHQG